MNRHQTQRSICVPIPIETGAGSLCTAAHCSSSTWVPAFWRGPVTVLNPRTGFLVVMYAPLVGALLARFLGPGVIQWGRPSWWILAALIPPTAALGVYLAAASLGVVAENSNVLSQAVTGAGGTVLLASLFAFGEEVGWRGFLWPLVRTRYGFLISSFVLGAVWWVYHVPFVFLGWYGTVAGLPAFTVSLIGATLFIGVVTDRSRSVWPSVFVHGAWNALVATSFAVDIGGSAIPAFSGADHLTGEFGWIPAITMLIVGGVATRWHLRDQEALSLINANSA